MPHWSLRRTDVMGSTPGELTDTGRRTTLELGERLRKLYVEQLGFLPRVLEQEGLVTLRATPIQRALESVQQVYQGLYPSDKRGQGLPPVTVVARAMHEETLFPNTGACQRFGQLFHMFSERAAKRWNESEEMGRINGKIGRWMPDERGVRVDSKPRLSGVMDTVNAVKAHQDGDIKLPREFLDEGVAKAIDTVACDEWYAGFRESQEYRTLGVGSLVGDLLGRMVWTAEGKRSNSGDEQMGRNSKMWLAGAHDTTLAGVLTSLGAFGDNPWPPFTSHVAIELFRARDADTQALATASAESARTWWSSLPFFGGSQPNVKTIARKPTQDLTSAERTLLRSHYVRLRYNSEVAVMPGCSKSGRHLEGDESFCTLEAFKEIVDEITPKDWKAQCRENLDKKELPNIPERAGWPRKASI